LSAEPIVTGTIGFPRIGPRRELKFALEKFWAGESDRSQLAAAAREIRRIGWQTQAEAGMVRIPSNDFSLYDHVLDTTVMVGAVPQRYARRGEDALATYFAMARGDRQTPAMEMTKWFDTNYHYIVPEFEAHMEFRLASRKPLEEYLEARALGFETRPVVLGPVSFAMLGQAAGDRAAIAEALAEVYGHLLRELAAAGARWVQIDEPCLGLDLPSAALPLFARVYRLIANFEPRIKILLATYFSDLAENLEPALDLPVAGLHLDLVRAPRQLDAALERAPAGLKLSLGIVDGRNIWRTDLEQTLALVRKAAERLGPERLELAPSCSLLHVPVDLQYETRLDPDLRSWLAFARQKLDELASLARAAAGNTPEIAAELAENQRLLAARRASARVRDPDVRRRVAAITPAMLQRRGSFAARRGRQIPLPLLPTTTIGSFPQTPEIRRARAAWRAGKLADNDYEALLRAEIERAIRFQEEVGLDVLAHGEFERSDMVEYFGERLQGFAFTENGWVQSYGSRCVKPPLIYGDVARPRPMTVAWARFAQSLTDRPVKGMLTGPVTMLAWSFVRDDLPRDELCFQVALALRDEVRDLESAGIRVIQVDEPALREGLPLRRAARPAYLRWAVDAFRLATAAVADVTQIHTHMCYAEFGEILDAIARMDADVISMEAARSKMQVLDAFRSRGYPNDIGPGVYDIHSPRVPEIAEMEKRIGLALQVFPAERLWVNPDCGLKTRRWDEVRPALQNLVAAARRIRTALSRASRAQG